MTTSGTGTDVIRLDIEARVKTDRLVSSIWLAVPAASFLLVVSAVAYTLIVAIQSVLQGSAFPQTTPAFPAFISFFGYLTAVLYVSTAVLLVLVYRLIIRRNRHFRREQALFVDLLALLGALAEQRNLASEFHARVAPAQSTLEEMKAKEPKRDALLWVVASFFVGALLPLVIYFLMKDYFNHEKREERFLQQLSIAASGIGVNLQHYGRINPLPNRSFAVYTVLTLFTYGFFALYWFYRLINDPNQHFASQWDIEDRLYGDLSRSTNGTGPA